MKRQDTFNKIDSKSTDPLRIDSIMIHWDDDTGPFPAEEQNPFGYIGCYISARVSYPIGDGSRRLETLYSGGLWGIDADSSVDYLREVEQEELEDLFRHLSVFGINSEYKVVSEMVKFGTAGETRKI